MCVINEVLEDIGFPNNCELLFVGLYVTSE